jgi:WD40 repeat protein
VDFRSKQPIAPPLEELEAHDLRVVCWECGPKWLVSGGADGTVQLRESGNLSAVKSYKVAGWKQENLSAVSYSLKGGIYTGSNDGCFQVWRIEGAEQLPDEHKVEEVTFKRIGKERNTTYF